MKIDEENEINLPNRKEFLEDNKNNKFNKVAIFDINGFGNINHYYGYDFGEKVLKLISLRLENKFLNSKTANTKTPWLDENYSTCIELTGDGEAGMIMEDFARA